MIRCKQTQCTHFTQGGCKNCDTCDAKPYELTEECKRCTTCESTPGQTRFDEIEQKEKEIMIIETN